MRNPLNKLCFILGICLGLLPAPMVSWANEDESSVQTENQDDYYNRQTLADLDQATASHYRAVKEAEFAQREADQSSASMQPAYVSPYHYNRGDHQYGRESNPDHRTYGRGDGVNGRQ
jgi:hypothetical protein